MIPPLTQCNRDHLESYLQGKVCADEMRAIELHLDGCDPCRRDMQLLAADPDFWVAASASLDASNDPTDEIPPLTVAGCLSVIEQGLLESAVQNEVDGGTRSYLDLWLGPARTSDSIGSLNEYDILEIVGSGGMGLVLKARDPALGRMVAIKTLRQHLTGDFSARRRFAREAQVAASLRHRHIIDIYTVEVWRDVPYFVMPFMPKGTLVDYKRAMHAQRFEFQEILTVVRQVASGLAEAHRRGMMHRDIKPSNVLIERGLDQVLIADFGLARAIDDEGLTCSGWLAGTPQFMSPEQARGNPIDHRSDLFSLGSLMYWLATGRPPFSAETNFGLISKIVNDRPPNPAQYRDDLPAWFLHLLDTLHSKDPNLRRYTAQDIATILEQFQSRGAAPVVPLPSGATEARVGGGLTWQRRTWMVSLLILGIIPTVTTISWWAAPRITAPAPKQSTEPLPSAFASRSLPEEQQPTNATASQVDAHSESPPWVSVAEATGGVEGANDKATSRTFARTGPLDSLDEVNLFHELPKGINARYWLERLANLPVNEIPLNILPVVEGLAKSNADEMVQQIATAIINKSPFEEIESQQHQPLTSADVLEKK